MRNKGVLWGHHLDEYRAMFDLSEQDLGLKLLEFAAGPSAVNSEWQQLGLTAVSCDPWFEWNPEALAKHVAAATEARIVTLEASASLYDFSGYGDLAGFIASRRLGQAAFFADYPRGRDEKRYLPVRGESLPFAEFEFDLALSPYYFLSPCHQPSLEKQLTWLTELARVAKEVRIYPLEDEGQLSEQLGPILLSLQQANLGVEVRHVSDPLRSKGNAMLRVWALQCEISG